MSKHSDHQLRIIEELKRAGTSSYGSLKFTSRYLPKVIHDDEHIEAIVYGRTKVESGMLGITTGMLIATDQRVIFLDHKPGLTSQD